MTSLGSSFHLSSIRDEDVAALYSSGQFDPEFYVTTYPDVRQTGLDPALHYLWLGARLGRLRRCPKLLEQSSGDALDVLFVDGTNGTSSTPYRVDRVANGLAHYGARVQCVRGDELSQVAKDNIRARHVTFFRAPFLEPYSSFAHKMRVAGSRIVFDVDDLVFEEDQIPIIDGYRLLTEREKSGYTRGVRAYRNFVLYADFCTAPTEFLASRMRDLGKKSFRLRNTLDQTEIERFGRIRRTADQRRFVVGYYSGSMTHQADFRHAGEALIRLMKEDSSVMFRLVGEFDLGEYPELYKWTVGAEAAPRVTQLGVMTHSEMLEDQLECDLIIAPLEVGNPFCEAKSELKFFEASLARRPVIASPTQTFRAATKNGEFAKLANDPCEWLEAFRNAIRNINRLRADADRAHDFVVEEYSPTAAGAEAADVYSESLAAAA